MRLGAVQDMGGEGPGRTGPEAPGKGRASVKSGRADVRTAAGAQLGSHCDRF